VETTISLWKQLSHCGNNYLTVETKNQLDVFLHTVKLNVLFKSFKTQQSVEDVNYT